jgi:hypothetical protein
LEKAFTSRLTRIAGDRWTEDEIARKATHLVALYQGVLVLVRAGYDLSETEKMLIAEFDELKRGSHVR